MEKPSDTDWMITERGIYIDIHETLRPYTEVLSFVRRLEQEFSIKQYCNGANEGGRWIYQFYSIDFIQNLSHIVNSLFEALTEPRMMLEVMAGDGLLSHYLEPEISLPLISIDNKSSRDDIEFPKTMECIDALEAVRKYDPSLVLISWEPFYSDIAEQIIETEVPVIWIGDPSSCAVSSRIHEIEYRLEPSKFLLGRHDSVLRQEFRTEMRIYNHPLRE